MNSNTFRNFREASDFAKALAKNGVRHNLKCEETLWVVYHDSTTPTAEHISSRELEELRKEFEAKEKQFHIYIKKLQSENALLQEKNDLLRNNIEGEVSKRLAEKKEFEAKEKQLHIHIKNLKSENASLQEEKDLLRNNIESVISKRLADEREALEKLKDGISRRREKLEEEMAKLECELHKLSLLEKAYSEKFGKAKVITVQEMVNSNSVCPRCGGDGGVNGGCQKCDGKGWVESMKMKTREVVKFV